MLPKKRPLTKWSRVVCRSSCLMSSTTSSKVREIIRWTLVCVSIHLECLLDKSRVEVVTWAAVGVANQQQFSYNPVTIQFQNFRSVNAIDVDSIRIRCALGECEFNSHSTKSSVKKPSFTCIMQHAVGQQVSASVQLLSLVCMCSSPLTVHSVHTGYAFCGL